MILVKKLDPDAIIPSRGTPLAIGLDLYALDEHLVHVGEVAKVRTGIAIAIPATHYGRIAPRSGLAVKHGIDVLAGVVDCDYRGEVIVALTKVTGPGTVTKIAKGDRVAQLILERADIMPVYEVGVLPPTVRGEGGFGSTGT